MPKIVHKDDGRIHCRFNQVGADTGRTSSNDPNLQNIPSRAWKLIDGTKIDAGHDVRRMFRASPGNILISCDYSAQEPRLTAHLSKDEKMVQAYKDGKDVYSEIASIAFNKTYEECLEFKLDENGHKTDITNVEGKERRTQAKSIVLGINYGRSIPSIAEQLNCSTEKAQQIYDDVLNKFSGLKAFKEESEANARKYGYVETVWGRKRRLPTMQLPYYEFEYEDGALPEDFDPLSSDIDETITGEVPQYLCEDYTNRLLNAKTYKQRKRIKDEIAAKGIIIKDNTKKIGDTTRQVVNARVQGSAADLTKLAMIKLYNNQELRDLGFKMLIPIHDEILAECPKENAKRCGALMEQMMIDAAKDLIVPISCDAEYTEQWYGEPIEFE
jgi:DNA polymerase-1